MPFHFSFVRMGSVKDCGTDAAWRFCHFCRLPTVPSVFKINNLAQGNGLKEHFHLLCMTHYLPRCSSKWKHISPEFLRIHEKSFISFKLMEFFQSPNALSSHECNSRMNLNRLHSDDAKKQRNTRTVKKYTVMRPEKHWQYERTFL